MNPVEEYEERKRLRRSRFRWRIFALMALVAAIALYLSQMEGPVGQHIARFEVSGVILDDPERDELLRTIAEEDQAEALILRINSPGGTVTGSEALYESLREIGEKKPVVAVMREVAASGGYIAALSADHVVARGNTITGSVGVVFSAPNAHELFERIGISVVEVKSGPLKAEPTPYKPVSPEVIAAEEELVADSFNWFVGLVKDRRDMGENALTVVKAGGVFTGRQAKEIGLIDEIGSEKAAIGWLESEKSIEDGREIVDYELGEDDPSLMDLVLKKAGLGPMDRSTLERGLSPSLLAIWR